MSDEVYYAIGDVHGLSDRLRALHQKLLEEHAASGQPGVIVHLGDYIDRGPDSRGAIAAILELQQRAAETDGLEVLSLRGNHEQMLLDAVDEAGDQALRLWLSNGGDAAIVSYFVGDEVDESGLDARWTDLIDPEHLAWLRTLPTMHFDPARKIVFVHAGIDPATFPACADEVRLWTRSPKFFEPKRWPNRPELQGLLVVHGHTPTEGLAPCISARRINVDTGAVYGGPLTAVALAPGKRPRLVQA